MTFKNKAQLKKVLSEQCAKAVGNTKDKIHMELAGNLNQFYTEFKPNEYIRTGALFNALDATNVIRTGNQHVSRAEAEVGFTTPHYEHGLVRLQSGEYGNSFWDDDYILDVVMADEFPHGGYEDGTAIWSESMQNLGGKQGINNLLIQELKKQGL